MQPSHAMDPYHCSCMHQVDYARSHAATRHDALRKAHACQKENTAVAHIKSHASNRSCAEQELYNINTGHTLCTILTWAACERCARIRQLLTQCSHARLQQDQGKVISACIVSSFGSALVRIPALSVDSQPCILSCARGCCCTNPLLIYPQQTHQQSHINLLAPPILNHNPKAQPPRRTTQHSNSSRTHTCNVATCTPLAASCSRAVASADSAASLASRTAAASRRATCTCAACGSMMLGVMQ